MGMRKIKLTFIGLIICMTLTSHSFATEMPINKEAAIIKSCADLVTKLLNDDTKEAEKVIHEAPSLKDCDAGAGWTVLGLIVGRGTPATTQFLLDAGANPNLFPPPSQYNDDKSILHTPFFTAIWQNKLDMIQLMLQHGADIHLKDYAGRSAVHYAAKESTETLAVIIKAGGNIEERTYNGSTPLHLALKSKKLDNVRFLLDQGANIESRNFYGLTPLALSACGYGTPDITTLLLKRNANIKAIPNGCKWLLNRNALADANLAATLKERDYAN